MHNTETSSLVKQHSTDFVVYVAVYSVPGTTHRDIIKTS